MRRKLWMAVSILALGSLLFAGQPAMAAPQEPSGSGSSASGQSEQAMHADLKLTDDQKNQVKSINQSRRDQLKTVAQDSSLTGEQKAARVREINKGSNEQIRGLLTLEQQQRFDRRWRDRREDVRDRAEDRRDAKHDGGVRDRREDVRDHREDVRDRREDRRDRKENVRDRRENRRDRRHRP